MSAVWVCGLNSVKLPQPPQLLISVYNKIIKIDILYGMINMFCKKPRNESDNAVTNCLWSQIKPVAHAAVWSGALKGLGQMCFVKLCNIFEIPKGKREAVRVDESGEQRRVAGTPWMLKEVITAYHDCLLAYKLQ